MAFRRALVIGGVVALTACAGGDEAVTTTPATTIAASSTAPSTTTTTTSTTTTVSPTTTVDETAVLAEIEQAYLDAFWVGKEALRDPDDPDNEARIRDHFTGANLDQVLQNLESARNGGLTARENLANPTFATVVESAAFIEDNQLARLTVCEFNSDRLFEVGSAPDGGDALRRDTPVSLLIVVRMELTDGRWKSQSGAVAEEINDEEERCTSVQLS